MRTEVTIDGGSSFFQGSMSDIVDFSSTEDATTIDPSNYNGGFGQITLSARPVRDSKMAQGKTLRLSDAAKGKTTGVVRDISITDRIVTFTGDSILGLFNTFHTSGPQIGTLSQAINAYCDLVGIPNIVEIQGEYYPVPGNPSEPLSTMPVNYPGFQGNVWDNIKRIMAAEQIEMALVYDKIVVRPLRTLQANLNRTISITESVNTQSTAKLVEVHYYPTDVIANGVVFPVENEESNVLQVDVGEYREFVLPLTASVSTINQPENLYLLNTFEWDGTTGAYVVCGNDGLPIPPEQWAAEGGFLTARIGEDSSTIIVGIQGSSNTDLAPFRIAESSGAGNFYSALYITGTGVRWTDEMITLTTGATSETTGEDVGATITNPFIQSLEQAYTAGVRASGTFAGPIYTVNGSALNINRVGGNRDSIAATFEDYNEWWADNHSSEYTIGDFNAVWNGYDFAQFNAFWDARMESLFSNQAFGNASGARVRLDDAFFRINSATISARNISYSASLDTIIGDFNEVNPGMTFADFNVQRAGYTFGDFAITPLRSTNG